MRAHELALQRDKYKHLSDEEWRWMLQQVDGRERTADKLPTFATLDDWWYPVRLSCEQCSSELTARYKASIVNQIFNRQSIVNRQSSNRQLLDLTAGYGVDTYFLSERFQHTDYVEQNAELCRIARHNFETSRKSKVERQKTSISIHNTTAEDFLLSAGQYDLIFLDPARRDSHGGKVFRLQDCTPDVVELLPTLLQHLTPDGRILLKLSPMLDITQALHALSAVQWDVHIVAVKNEVKEVLLCTKEEGRITAIDLAHPEQFFSFTKEEEKNAQSPIVNSQFSTVNYLYEPNAAILKSGAYKLVAQRFHLTKLDSNTHLYVSDEQIAHFPGRVWTILHESANEFLHKGDQVNILCRNYPLTPDQLKKKYHLRDGGSLFLIGCRIAGKPTLLFAQPVS